MVEESLTNKVAIVTGARRGIGKAIALKLAREGAKVAITDINKEDCEEVIKEIEKLGGEGLALKLDVTNEEEIGEVVETTKEKFGRIDILVNNAGIIDIEEIGDSSKINKILEVNLKGVLRSCNAVIPTMVEQKTEKLLISLR